MDVGSIILGLPWFYDADATIYGKSNTCTFLNGGKRFRIQPLEPKANSSPTHDTKIVKPNSIHLNNAKEFDQETKELSLLFA